jgi:hypothetical protein
MSKKRKAPACGNPDCGVSMGVCDMLTFGSGELDHYGFWQHPCRVCAAAFDAGRDARLAGLEREYRERFPNDPEHVDEMMKDANWAREPAWPFAEEMVPAL